MKNKTSLNSENNNLISILMNNLHINRDMADSIIADHPTLSEVDPQIVDNIIMKFQYKYLFVSSHIVRLLKSQTELFTNPEIVQAKESFFRNIFCNISDVEIGQILALNPNFMFLPNEDLGRFIDGLKKQSGATTNFVKKLLLSTSNIDINADEYSTTTLKNKFELLNIYGITREDIENHPAICSNKLTNIDYKLKLALLLNVPLKTYVEDEKFKLQKEKAFARGVAIRKLKYKTEIYCSESVFSRQTKLNTEDLMKYFPWDEKAEQMLNNSFAKKFPEINTKLQDFYAKLNSNSESEQ